MQTVAISQLREVFLAQFHPDRPAGTNPFKVAARVRIPLGRDFHS